MAATMTLGRVVGPVIPALVVLGFFVWFSNWIPQTRWEPPKARAIGAPALAGYLTQSLYEPGAYLVEGYANIMPPSFRPPAKLTYEEMTAVVNYLMSLGGTPTVKAGALPRPPAAAGRAVAALLAAPGAPAARAALGKDHCL